MKRFVFCFLLIFSIISLKCQTRFFDSCHFFNPCPRNYEVKHAIEVEFLVPMFFYGGYHYAICYRYKNLRIRASVINGGSYNAETAGVPSKANLFNRYYAKTGMGIFFGYNVWRNLEIYSYIERHHFKIEEKSSSETGIINSTDFGIASSYQIFIGRYIYVQPGIHFYFRKRQSLTFPDLQKYTIPSLDISPVVRIGIRLWRKY